MGCHAGNDNYKLDEAQLGVLVDSVDVKLLEDATGNSKLMTQGSGEKSSLEWQIGWSALAVAQVVPPDRLLNEECPERSSLGVLDQTCMLFRSAPYPIAYGYMTMASAPALRAYGRTLVHLSSQSSLARAARG